MKTQARVIATRLRSNALAGLFFACLMLGIAPFLRPSYDLAFWLLWPLLFSTLLGVVAVAAHLLFDAALFRHVANTPDEDTALGQLDTVLERMELRKANQDNRPLADRIAGSKRILWRLHIFLGLGIPIFILLAIIPSGGKW